MNNIITETDRKLVELENQYGADALAKCNEYEYLCRLLTYCEEDEEIDDFDIQEIARCLNEIKKELGIVSNT